MHIDEWARRHAKTHDQGSALADLLEGRSDDEVALRRGMPAVRVEGVRSFYELLGKPFAALPCAGTACWSARKRLSTPSSAPGPETPHAQCYGRCYEAPCDPAREPSPMPRLCLPAEPIVLRHVLGTPSPPLAQRYALPPPEVFWSRLETSGLRGRGGAAYPTATKWRAAQRTPSDLRYVVANGDEGDPGSFVDRLLLEEDPHSVLAGMNACARAIGASRGVVFIRGEYPVAVERTRAAVAEAAAAGVLVPGFEVVVHVGAGSYVCGEETALLRAIEGLRAEPSPKPPYPAEQGLFGKPTVVQNVETLALVPWIAATARRPITKAFSVAGAVAQPGVVEAELGIPLSRLLSDGAGGPAAGRKWKLAVVGGPMGRIVPATGFDVALGYDTLPGMGHGGIVVLDDSVSAGALARHLYAFAAGESCGNCTPCRVGTSKLAQMRDATSLVRLLDTLELGSLCGFGQGVPRPLRDLLQHFPDELFDEVRS